MSDVTGADLEQLDALAAVYRQRGAEIAERAGDLNRRLLDAVTTFQTSLADLRARVTTANQALLEDVDELAQTAVGTVWTGANRTAFDTDLATLLRGIADTTEVLTSRIDELEHRGVAPFADTLIDFGRQVSGAGDTAEQVGSTMRTRVADQGAALREAADTGWSPG